METHAGIEAAVLETNRRQQHQRHRDAIALLRQGQAEEGLKQLDRLKAITVIPDEAKRYRQLAQDYVHALNRKKEVLAVSPTHGEGEQVTTAIRQALREEHKLRDKEKSFPVLQDLRWSTVQRREAHRYQPGMVVQFHRDTDGFKNGEQVRVVGKHDNRTVQVERSNGIKQLLQIQETKHFQVFDEKHLSLAVGERIRITRNGKTLNGQALSNGDIYHVKGFTKEGNIRLTNNQVIAQGYGNLAYGYCVTSHASQGKTVDQVLIAQSSRSERAATKEQFYVSASRFRESIRIYTDDKESLQQAIVKSSRRVSALDMVKGLRPENQKLTPRQRVWQSVFQASRKRRTSLLKLRPIRQTFAETLSRMGQVPSRSPKLGI